MRPEVQQALNEAKINRAYIEQHGELSPAAHAKLDQLYTLMSALKTCLHNQPMLTEVQYGTSWMLDIEWGVPKAQIVLEVSSYGRFAALYQYGEPPSAAILAQVMHCLAAHEITLLSDEETDELYPDMQYFLLF